jgi:ABC-type multidrug transport system fused ATPase/permease subunit
MLENGKIVEQGNYEELMLKKGKFFELSNPEHLSIS